MPVFLKTSRVLSFWFMANENKHKIRFRILISLLYIWSELKLCLGSCKVSELKLRSFLKYLLVWTQQLFSVPLLLLFSFFFHLSCPSELRREKIIWYNRKKTQKQNRKILLNSIKILKNRNIFNKAFWILAYLLI